MRLSTHVVALSTMTLPANATLADAREWLLQHVDEGTKCPCCTQMAKVYRRKINSGMARALIALYRTSRKDPHAHYHLASLARWTHEGGQLAWWGLITQDDARRDDGGQSGWWRITPLGEKFVRQQVLVGKYMRIYDGRPLGLGHGGGVSIKDALGKKFNYADLMAGR